MSGRFSLLSSTLVLLLNCIHRSSAHFCGRTEGWNPPSYEPVLRGVQINGPTPELTLEFYNKTRPYLYNEGDRYCPLSCDHTGADGRCLDGYITTESHCKVPYFTTGYSVDYFSKDNSFSLTEIKRAMQAMPCDNIPFTPGAFFYMTAFVVVFFGAVACFTCQNKEPYRPTPMSNSSLPAGDNAQDCSNCSQFKSSKKEAAGNPPGLLSSLLNQFQDDDALRNDPTRASFYGSVNQHV